MLLQESGCTISHLGSLTCLASTGYTQLSLSPTSFAGSSRRSPSHLSTFLPTGLFISEISVCLNPVDCPPPHFKRSLSSYSFQKVLEREVASGRSYPRAFLCSIGWWPRLPTLLWKMPLNCQLKPKGVKPSIRSNRMKTKCSLFQARTPLFSSHVFMFSLSKWLPSEHLKIRDPLVQTPPLT